MAHTIREPVDAPFFHDTAVVEDGVSCGPGTKVWHHCHLRSGAVIGAACTLGKNVFVDSGVTIGDRVKVQNNVSVYRGVHLEDDVFVGPSAVFTNDRFPRAPGGDWEVVDTLVSQGASIGANATIVCGVVLGRWSAVGAGAVVTRDVAPHELVVGNPARRLGWVCRCGRVLAKSTAAIPPMTCAGCGFAFLGNEP